AAPIADDGVDMFEPSDAGRVDPCSGGSRWSTGRTVVDERHSVPVLTPYHPNATPFSILASINRDFSEDRLLDEHGLLTYSPLRWTRNAPEGFDLSAML